MHFATYLGIFITRHVYCKLKDSKHNLKDELCLSELNDVHPEEMKDESNKWMTEVNRGGLKHVTNMIYCMFASAEIEIRNHIQLQHTSESDPVNILDAKKKKCRMMMCYFIGQWCPPTGRRRWPLYYWTCWWIITLRSGAILLPQLGWRNTRENPKRNRKESVNNWSPNLLHHPAKIPHPVTLLEIS